MARWSASCEREWRIVATKAKSTGPELLPPGAPTSSWSVDQLGKYVEAQHLAIDTGEKALAPLYWKLGLALKLAKRHFNHGQWSKCLENWGISKARAARATAIYRTFGEEHLVIGLAVEEAYGRRQRKTHSRREKAQDGPSEKAVDIEPLQAFLQDAAGVAARAESLIDDAAFCSKERAQILIPTLCEVIQRLETLRAYLQRADGA